MRVTAGLHGHPRGTFPQLIGVLLRCSHAPISPSRFDALHQTRHSSVRGDDLVARLGGDEFAILLPGRSSPEGEQQVADRIR
ncbi:diguanylate cyclase domain-containing protein [Kineosporia babensis]